MEKIKPVILILSDLWGFRKVFPLESYKQLLEKQYQVHYYDSTSLAGIPSQTRKQSELHQAFVNGGIEKAVINLQQKEPDAQYLLGLSVGGMIAWRYALSQPAVKSLTTISATRLRYESLKPDCAIELYYGQLDPYQPSEDWYRQMTLNATIIPNKDHNVYRNEEFLRESFFKLK